MLNIGVFYYNNKISHEDVERLEKILKHSNNDLSKKDRIKWFIIPSDKNYIEIWGDTTENCKLSKALIKKLKHSDHVQLGDK